MFNTKISHVMNPMWLITCFIFSIPSRSSFVKLFLHLQLGKIPPLTLHPPPPLSHTHFPLLPTSLGLFQLSCWTVSSFMTRPCSVHFCVLCTTLLYLK